MILIACFALIATAFAGLIEFVDNAKFTPFSTWGHGACGHLIDASNGFFASVAPSYYTTSNPNDDPICNRCVKVSNNDQTLILPVVDKCFGCKENEMMLSEPAFQQLAGSKTAWEINGGSWKFVSCTPPPAPPPPPPSRPTHEYEIELDGDGAYFYFNTAGVGACGARVNGSSEMVVGFSAVYFSTENPNNDPLCQKCVQVDYKGQSMTLPIKDKCEGCPDNAIMLSQVALEKLYGKPVPNRVYDWSFVSDGSWKLVSC